MANTFTAVDLAQLPFPDAVEVPDFETILAQMLTDLQARDSAFTALVESDPAFKVLEVAAYRELLVRQRVNEAIKAVCLAYAIGDDLEQIGARYNVPRLLLDAGDPDTIPPIPPTYEPDADYRRRIQLSFEGFSTAGPVGAYIFHSLAAAADVLDAAAKSPEPGTVLVTVLSRTGDGVADAALLAAVEAALLAEDVRPLTDTVVVQSAAIVEYTVAAELALYSGPDAEVVLQSAQAALDAYTADMHRIGRDVTLSGIYAALHQPGVQNVVLASPLADVVISDEQASHCTGTTLTTVASDE